MVFPVCTFHCLTLNFVYAQIRLLGVEPMYCIKNHGEKVEKYGKVSFLAAVHHRVFGVNGSLRIS